MVLIRKRQLDSRQIAAEQLELPNRQNTPSRDSQEFAEICFGHFQHFSHFDFFSIFRFEAKSQGEEPDAPDAAGSAPVQTTPVTTFTPVGQGKCNFQCPDLRGPEKAVCVAVSEQ